MVGSSVAPASSLSVPTEIEPEARDHPMISRAQAGVTVGSHSVVDVVCADTISKNEKSILHVTHTLTIQCEDNVARDAAPAPRTDSNASTHGLILAFQT